MLVKNMPVVECAWEELASRLRSLAAVASAAADGSAKDREFMLWFHRCDCFNRYFDHVDCHCENCVRAE